MQINEEVEINDPSTSNSLSLIVRKEARIESLSIRHSGIVQVNKHETRVRFPVQLQTATVPMPDPNSIVFAIAKRPFNGYIAAAWMEAETYPNAPQQAFVVIELSHPASDNVELHWFCLQPPN